MNTSPRATAPAHDLPKNCDVVIIGGGIIGTAAAYYLARQGQSVVLFEKGRIAGEQSSRNWGAVRQQGRHPAELPLMMDCNRLWQGLEQNLEAGLDWRQQGQMRVAFDKQRLEDSEAWLPIAKEHGLDTHILTPAQVAKTLPHFDSTGCLGAMFTPSDGCAEPEKVAPAFAAAAKRLGAKVADFCGVLSLDIQNGQVCGVESEQGSVAAATVVCAAGAWTSRLLRSIGHRHPSLWVRASVGRSGPIPLELRKLVVWSRCAYRQRPDRRVTVAAASDGYHDLNLDSLRFGLQFLPLAKRNRRNLKVRLGSALWQDLFGRFADPVQQRTIEPPPAAEALDRALKDFQKDYPGAGPMAFEKTWAGYIDYMPDELPVIDELDHPGGLFIAAGLSGHGFGIGPMVGSVVADLIVKGQSRYDLSPFKAGRFEFPQTS
ncbi:MAG: FAD-binding oxidoreductase [Pseudomonadota bacterium]